MLLCRFIYQSSQFWRLISFPETVGSMCVKLLTTLKLASFHGAYAAMYHEMRLAYVTKPFLFTLFNINDVLKYLRNSTFRPFTVILTLLKRCKYSLQLGVNVMRILLVR
jgi:hypothetical protein